MTPRLVRFTACAVFVPAVLVLVGGNLRAERPDFAAPVSTDVVVTVPAVTAIAGAAQPSVAAVRTGTPAVLIPPATVLAPTTTYVLPAPMPSLPNDPCQLVAVLLVTYAPPSGWDADRMLRYAQRESGPHCQADAWNARGHASGVLQVTPINYPFLREALGEWVDRWTLTDPVQNVRAAAALCEYWSHTSHGCYWPWVSA